MRVACSGCRRHVTATAVMAGSTTLSLATCVEIVCLANKTNRGGGYRQRQLECLHRGGKSDVVFVGKMGERSATTWCPQGMLLQVWVQ